MEKKENYGRSKKKEIFIFKWHKNGENKLFNTKMSE